MQKIAYSDGNTPRKLPNHLNQTQLAVSPYLGMGVAITQMQIKFSAVS